MSRRASYALAGGLVAVAAVAIVLAGVGGTSQAIARCTGADAVEFGCQQRHYVDLFESSGATVALRDLAADMKDNGYVRAACHQLTHRIGRAAGATAGIMAYKEGDPVCGSGYYHGVTEAAMTKLGPDGDSGRRRPSAAPCARRTVDHPNSTSLRPGEPLYPCTAVARRYKEQCYDRQSTYALFVSNGSFEQVFRLCGKAEPGFRGACRGGLGGDVAAETKLVAPKARQARSRHRLCMLGRSSRARADCVGGAVGVILQDLDGARPSSTRSAHRSRWWPPSPSTPPACGPVRGPTAGSSPSRRAATPSSRGFSPEVRRLSAI